MGRWGVKIALILHLFTAILLGVFHNLLSLTQLLGDHELVDSTDFQFHS